MDRNLLIAFVISFFVLFLWGRLQEQQYPNSSPSIASEGINTDGKTESDQPKNVSDAAPAPAPAVASREEIASVAREKKSQEAASVSVTETAPITEPAEQIIEIKNELYRAEFSSHGAALRHFELLQYRDEVNADSNPVVLTWFDRKQAAALTTSFEELGLGDLSHAAYTVAQPSPNILVFERNQAGLILRKTYTFSENAYNFALRMEVLNGSNRSIQPIFAVAWPGRVAAKKSIDEQQSLVAYHQKKFEHQLMAVFGKPGFLAKLISVGNDKDKTQVFDGDIEWIGLANRYFVSAILPDEPAKTQAKFLPVESGVEAIAILQYQPIEILPGSAKQRDLKIYMGPKEANRLEALGRNFERVAVTGYSWVSPLTSFFTWFLMLIHKVVPNYGLAIIVVTILVRAAAYPIVSQQMKSMKRMAEVQPKMKALQDKYKDDRQALSQAMMRLYKEEGVNPLGGCLPALLQFPVFIGLFFALQSSIELRHAPFWGWINDLSSPELLFQIPVVNFPFRLLPVLMGASMFLQQRITPMTTMDPMQRKMMTTFMPFMLLAVSYTFPSGLVLYWITSNLLGIGQQFITNRQMPTASKEVKK